MICLVCNEHSNDEALICLCGAKLRWRCPNCTLHNLIDSSVCKACAYQSNNDEWACKRCSFLNQNASVCCMCKYHRCKDLPNLGLQREKSVALTTYYELQEDVIKRQYDEIISMCRRHKVTFIDDSFQPIDRSIYLQNSWSQSKAPVKWLRPCEICTDNTNKWAVFRNPASTDIVQGVLGDCWLLSSLSVIAEIPDLLTQLIPKYNIDFGCFLVRLYVFGNWVAVAVDDLLPCNASNKILFSFARRNQLWVSLIEKAYAKVSGCYYALNAGKCIEGLAILTGFPCESINLTGDVDRDLLYAKIFSACQTGYLLGASCGGGCMTVNDDEYNKVGLRPRHAYSILQLKTLQDNTKLVQLRNPWGRFSWTGDWSDNSKLWTLSLREKLSAYGSDEGVFWISFHDLLKYFDSVDVCKVDKKWQRSSLSVGLSPEIQCIKLIVPQTSEVHCTLWQKSLRRLDSAFDIALVVCRGSEARTMALNSRRAQKFFVSCSGVLEPGEYIIVPLTFNRINEMKTNFLSSDMLNLVVHSQRQIEINHCSLPYIADALICMATAIGEQKSGRIGMTLYFVSNRWSGLLLVAENRNVDRWVNVHCDCKESFNVVSTRGTLVTIDSIPPLHCQVLVILTQLEVSEGFKIAQKVSHCDSNQSGLLEFGYPNKVNEPFIPQHLKHIHSPRPI